MLGSGVFASGAGETGGRLIVSRIETDAIYSDARSKRFPDTGGWAYAQFDYDPTSATYTPDKAGTPNCGHVCHVAVKAKDYVFHPYQNR